MLCGSPVVAKTAIPTSGAARMADIAIRYRDFMALKPDEKLFSHFGEAGTAIFAVEQVKYDGHDRTPLFDQAPILSRHHFKPSSPSPQNGFMS